MNYIMKKDRFETRRKRVRAKVSGTLKCPRLNVFKSNKYIYVQVIDDDLGKTLAQVNQKDFSNLEKLGIKTSDLPKEMGKKIAAILIKKGIKKVVFDKSGYTYHGKIKMIADGAREGGLIF